MTYPNAHVELPPYKGTTGESCHLTYTLDMSRVRYIDHVYLDRSWCKWSSVW